MRNPSALHVWIVHFNTPEQTSELVKSLPSTSSAGRMVTMHVLDNASTPANAELLRATLAGLGNVRLELGTRNLGFGGGMNRLAETSSPADDDIVWMLNPDTEVVDDCLERLERSIDEHLFDIVSPLILTGSRDEPTIWFCGGVIDTRRVRVRHLLDGAPASNAPTEPFPTEFITGAAPMLRAMTFRTLGGFDDDYFLYWEDVKLSWVARSRGITLGVIPAARLWHEAGAASGGGTTPTFFYWSTRNRIRFADDLGQRRWKALAAAGGLETARLLIRPVKSRRRWGGLHAAVRGTFHGLTRNTRNNPHEGANR